MKTHGKRFGGFLNDEPFDDVSQNFRLWTPLPLFLLRLSECFSGRPIGSFLHDDQPVFVLVFFFQGKYRLLDITISSFFGGFFDCHVSLSRRIWRRKCCKVFVFLLMLSIRASRVSIHLHLFYLPLLFERLLLLLLLWLDDDDGRMGSGSGGIVLNSNGRRPVVRDCNGRSIELSLTNCRRQRGRSRRVVLQSGSRGRRSRVWCRILLRLDVRRRHAGRRRRCHHRRGGQRVRFGDALEFIGAGFVTGLSCTLLGSRRSASILVSSPGLRIDLVDDGCSLWCNVCNVC